MPARNAPQRSPSRGRPPAASHSSEDFAQAGQVLGDPIGFDDLEAAAFSLDAALYLAHLGAGGALRRSLRAVPGLPRRA